MALDPTYTVSHHLETLPSYVSYVMASNGPHDREPGRAGDDNGAGRCLGTAGQHTAGEALLRYCCVARRIGRNPNSWTSGDELNEMGSALGEWCNRWDELVTRKMPHSHGRGILTTGHSFQEPRKWRRYMRRKWRQYMRRIRTSIPIEHTNAEGEAQPESRDDEAAGGETN